MIFTLIIGLTLVLYCPFMTLLCILTPWQGFRLARVQHRRQTYLTLHLSIYDRVGHLNRRRAARFHRSFLTTLTAALQQEPTPVYFISHLLRPAHLRSMTVMLTTAMPACRWHCLPVRIPQCVRTGITIQILLQEWRWVTVPKTGVLVVIHPAEYRSANRYT